MHECMLIFWNFAVSSLQLREPTLSSASLLPSTKCHKSFSNFLLIVDFFASSRFLQNWFWFRLYLAAVTYVITSMWIVTRVVDVLHPFMCIALSCSHCDRNPFIGIVYLWTYYFLGNIYARYVQKTWYVQELWRVLLPCLRRRNVFHPA